MINPPDTCEGVCNTPLPIRNKFLINTYLLNPILGNDWIVRVGAYCICPTNAHNHGQMIDPPDTCEGVCNTPLPIRDKYLTNTYLLYLISGKDWMVRVKAYYIRPTNTHDHGQMIDPPDTCWGVCNTPLPIRIKNLIPLCTMNLKPDTCWGVCNTPLPIRDKYLINMHLLNPIPGNNSIVHVEAYCIRPTNTHDHGQMINPPDTCWGVCNTPLPIRNKFLINTYLLNPILGNDWIVRVGAYCICPTNAHNHGQMIDPPDTCEGVCNTPLPIRDKYLTNTYLLYLISGKDWMVRVKAYYIRPTNTHDHGQMIDPPDTCWGVCNTPLPIRIKNLIPLCTMNLKPDTCWGVCNTPLQIRTKNLIPLYWVYLKLGRFWDVCLCDQSHPDGKHLKFVFMIVKPAED